MHGREFEVVLTQTTCLLNDLEPLVMLCYVMLIMLCQVLGLRKNLTEKEEGERKTRKDFQKRDAEVDSIERNQCMESIWIRS